MKKIRFLISLVAVVSFALQVKAHRLDEYLQATRIDLSSNHVDLEIDLTPGVEVANAVLALMDTNHDGNISTREGEAYAKLVLKTVVLEVDKQRHEVKLSGVRFPPVSEMKSGRGTVQLTARAEFASVIPGPHRIYFQNQHQTNLSVYLINAYVPKSPAIQITRQKRDALQTEMWIDCTFSKAVAAPPHAAADPSAAVRPGRAPTGFHHVVAMTRCAVRAGILADGHPWRNVGRESHVARSSFCPLNAGDIGARCPYHFT